VDNEIVASDHRQFFERFQSFWAAPTGARVAELIAPHAVIHFTGAGTMSGAEYVDWMTNQLAALPDLVVTPVDYAGSGEMVYVFWNAAATINGAYRRWYGVDRFRIENGMEVEEHVIFDSAACRGRLDPETQLRRFTAKQRPDPMTDRGQLAGRSLGDV
jgi:predicted SnoaL-like aldol condensation-catalyzing enzyme